MTALRFISLSLEGVGCFADRLDMTFAPSGLTVIHGPNEAGKSTALAGIGAVLFGVRTQDLGRWRSDPERAVCRGALEFQVGDARYTIARDFPTHATTVTDAAGGIVLDGKAMPGGRQPPAKRYQAWLEELIGFATLEAFQNSAHLALATNDTVLEYGNTVRELVSGAGAEDFTAVQASLEDAFDALTCENPWGRRKRNDREIEKLRQEIVHLETALGEADQAAAARQAAAEAVQQANEAAAAAAGAERTAREAEERWSNVQKVMERLDTANARAEAALARRQEAQDLRAEIRDCEAQLAAEFGDLAGVTDDTVAALDRAEQLEADARNAACVADAQPALPPMFTHYLPAGLVALCGLIVAAVLAGASRAGAVMVAVAALAIAAWYGWRIAGQRRRHAAIATKHAATQAKLAEEAAAARAALSDRVRQTDSATLRARVQARATLETKLGVLRDREANLPSVEELEAAVRQANADAGRAEARLEELDAKGVAPKDVADALARAKQDRARAAEDARNADAQQRSADHQSGAATASGFPPVATLCEQIAGAKDRLAALELRRDALRIAVETLREAAADFQRDHVGPISAEATTLFRTFASAGWDVVLNQDDFAPTVRWQGRPWEHERLSTGTRDQLAVAVRLAVVRALAGRVHLPLILDDPLAHWDAARRATFRDTLTRLARSHQVILATTDETLADWGQEQVRLGGAGVLDYTQMHP